ncbi:MAG: transposase family protein, partial [Lentilactobacillus hilgardii]
PILSLSTYQHQINNLNKKLTKPLSFESVNKTNKNSQLISSDFTNTTAVRCFSTEQDISERNASQNKETSNKPTQIGTMVNNRSTFKPLSIDQVKTNESNQIVKVNERSDLQPYSIESELSKPLQSRDLFENTYTGLVKCSSNKCDISEPNVSQNKELSTKSLKITNQKYQSPITQPVSTTPRTGHFILDSAAVTSTINSDNFHFEQTEQNNSTQLAILANGNTIPILKKGKLKIGTTSIDCVQIGIDAPNLLSIPQLTKIGYTVIFHNDIALLLPPIHTINEEIQLALKHWSHKWKNYAIQIQQENGLYSLDVTESGDIQSQIRSIYCDNTPTNQCHDKKCHHACLVNVNKINLEMKEPPTNLLFNLHCAFGHISVKNLIQLGIPLTDEDQIHIKHCLTCLSIKHKMKPTTKLKDRNTTQIFQKLHMDTAGPFSVSNKKWWVVLIIDEYSRYIHSIVTDSYGTINAQVNNWLCEQHIKHNRQPELITTDKGSEFKNIEYLLPEAYANKGYQPLIRPLMNYTPIGNKQWNVLAERA